MEAVGEKTMQDQELIRQALHGRKAAYAPYSHFLVGAALLCEDGSVYLGCNIENASYPAGNCAERTAVFKAIGEGKRRWKGIAIVGGREGEKLVDCFPCGICRQVLREFCDPSEFFVIIAKSEQDYKKITLEELLPFSFGPDQMGD